MAVHLPEELVFEILNRLPPKSLLRFTSVCKSWYSLITSPRFINTHLQLAGNDIEKELILCSIDPRKYYTHRDNVSFDKLSELDFPFNESCTLRNVGVHNGVICIKITQNNTLEQNVCLWNPSIWRLFRVPQTDRWGSVGFGFVPETNDYKIINICSDFGLKNVGVYELGSGSWKNFKFTSKYGLAAEAPQCFLNDTIHWIGYEVDENNRPAGDCQIVTFNVKNDNLGLLKMPTNISYRRRQIMSYKDSLAVIDESVPGAEYGSYRLYIYVMNKYGVSDSWTKHHIIDLTFPHIHHKHLLKFRHNGEALLRSHTYDMSRKNLLKINYLLSYDFRNRKIESLKEMHHS